MNTFVILAIIILSYLACIGLVLWWRKRRLKWRELKESNLDIEVENFDHPDVNTFDPGKYED